MSDRLDIHSFRKQHADWLSRFPEGPLYGLPKESIARLAKPSARRAAMLDSSAVRAEGELHRLCQQASAVGFDGSRPIDYPCLTSTLPLPDWNQYPDLGWSDAHKESVKTLTLKTTKAKERLAAYVGWLLTEPPYLNAVQDLSLRWGELPDALRPGFPLLRPTMVTVTEAPEGSSLAPDPVRAWAADFTEFCDRWGLVGMATWTLPSPQGPHLPSLLPIHSPALPARAVCLILPIHYHLTGDHDLMNTILEQQRELARHHGLDPSVAGLPHYKKYNQILKVTHYEWVIHHRYAQKINQRYSVEAVVEAIAEGTSQSVEQVKRLRKIISQCHSGRRSEVKSLQPPKQ